MQGECGGVGVHIYRGVKSKGAMCTEVVIVCRAVSDCVHELCRGEMHSSSRRIVCMNCVYLLVAQQRKALQTCINTANMYKQTRAR